MNKFMKLSEQIPTEPEAWTCEDVSKWLCLIEMEQYVENFKEMSIDGWLIFEIEEEDLVNDLKISKKLHRKKIMKGIEMLKEYKMYVRNNLTKKDLQQDTQFDGLPEKPKDSQEATGRNQENRFDRVHRKDSANLRNQFDDQTRHQDMKSRITPEQGSQFSIKLFGGKLKIY